MVEPVAWISPTGRLGSTHFTRLSPFHYTGRVGVVKKLPSKTPHGLEPKWPTMVSPQVTYQPLWQYHCSTQKFHYVTFCFKTRQVAMPSRCQSCDALLTDGGTCGLNLAHRSAGFDSFRSPFSTPLYWLGGCGPENHLQLNEGRSHHLALSQNGSQWCHLKPPTDPFGNIIVPHKIPLCHMLFQNKSSRHASKQDVQAATLF